MKQNQVVSSVLMVVARGLVAIWLYAMGMSKLNEQTAGTITTFEVLDGDDQREQTYQTVSSRDMSTTLEKRV